ncbi:LamG domain-containing protein [Amnibacterium kyonggiense]
MRPLLAGLRGRALGVAALAAAALLGLVVAAVPAASGGFTATLANGSDTVTTATYFTCSAAIAPDLPSAYLEWPLSDDTGAISSADLSGNGRTATFVGTTAMSAATPLGCPRDTGSALVLDGTSTYAYSATSVTGPQVFTIEAYFQTTAAQGKIIGFGNKSTGNSTSYDRHLYITTAGRLSFGVYNGTSPSYHVITSPAAVTDGAWHHVAATLSADGMKLYLDGALVASDPTTTAAENSTGYWRVGDDNVSGWPGGTASGFFAGRLRDVGVYTVALTAQQVAAHAAPAFGS